MVHHIVFKNFRDVGRGEWRRGVSEMAPEKKIQRPSCPPLMPPLVALFVYGAWLRILMTTHILAWNS